MIHAWLICTLHDHCVNQVGKTRVNGNGEIDLIIHICKFDIVNAVSAETTAVKAISMSHLMQSCQLSDFCCKLRFCMMF